MNRKERIGVSALVILILLLFVKSLFLDTYEPKNSEESIFYEEVSNILNEKESSWLYTYNIVKTRIVNIKPMSERERTVKDDDGNTYEVSGIYKAKVRKYIFGILPFSENTVLDVD
jgi:hypothetical protein